MVPRKKIRAGATTKEGSSECILINYKSTTIYRGVNENTRKQTYLLQQILFYIFSDWF